jgi:hypothetical protein
MRSVLQGDRKSEELLASSASDRASKNRMKMSIGTQKVSGPTGAVMVFMPANWCCANAVAIEQRCAHVSTRNIYAWSRIDLRAKIILEVRINPKLAPRNSLPQLPVADLFTRLDAALGRVADENITIDEVSAFIKPRRKPRS